MAAVVLEDDRQLTTDGATYASNSFSCPIGNLMVVFAQVTDSTAGAGTCSSNSGITFTSVGSFTTGSSTDTLYCWVANSLSASIAAQIVTVDVTGDNGTGCIITVLSISGLSRVGLSAIRQFAGQSDQAGGGTPEAVFAAAALTGNPVLAFLANASNPAGVTEPSGFTELSDIGNITPDSGTETAFINSGFTSDTVTWGSTSATDFGSFIVEIDASAAGGGLLLLGVGR